MASVSRSGTGPITTKLIDTAVAGKGKEASPAPLRRKTEGSRASADEKNSGLRLKSQIEQLRVIVKLKSAVEDIEDANKQLALIDAKRMRLMREQSRAMKSSNIELVDHYSKQLGILASQKKYVEQTVKQEEKRKGLMESYEVLDQKRIELAKTNTKLSDAELGVMQRQASQLLEANKTLLVRNAIQKVAVRDSLALREAETQISNDLQQQVKFQEILNRNKQKFKEAFGGREDEDTKGMSVGQKMLLSASGKVAGIAAGWSSYELAKKTLSSLTHSSDIATEAQYNFGVSLDRTDKSISGYLGRTKDLTKLNSELAWSFANMGLGAEEAAEVVPKLLASSGIAMRAFQQRDMETVKKLANNAGAFARQTGLSVEEAAQFQNSLMATRGMTAEQANSQMAGIVGSIRGMNDILDGAGFKGSLLNVGEYANLVKSASESTEELAFNTEDYAKRLAKAAKNMRAMGVSEKEASKYAAARAGLETNKDPYRDFRKGQLIVSKLNKQYGKEIESKDVEGLAKRMQEDYQLEYTQALSAASMMTSQEKTPMLATQMSNLLRETTVSRDANAEFVKAEFDKLGIKSKADIWKARQSPVLNAILGIDQMDQKNLMTQYVLDYLGEKAVDTSKFAPGTSPAALLGADAEEAARKRAMEEATAAQTSKNAAFSFSRMAEHARSAMSNPLVTAAGSAALGAGTIFGAPRLMRGASSLFGKASSLFGRGGGSVLGKGIETAVVKETEQSFAKTAGKSLLKGIARSKYGKLGLGVAGLAGLGYGGSNLLGSSTSPGDDQTAKAVTEAATTQVSGLDDNTSAIRNNTEALLASKSATYRVLAETRQKTYTQSVGANAMDAGSQAVVEGGLMYGSKALAPLATKTFSKIAPELAGKALAGTVAKTGARAVPLLGPLLSGAMTAYLTEGSAGRKVAATLGDVGGTALGQLATGGIGGGIVGGAAGQFALLSAYDKFFADSEQGKPVQASGAIDLVKPLSMQDATQAGTSSGTASLQSPTIQGLSIGKLGSVRADGSVDMTLTARVAGFVPAVTQAGAMDYARKTQFSGAFK